MSNLFVSVFCIIVSYKSSNLIVFISNLILWLWAFYLLPIESVIAPIAYLERLLLHCVSKKVHPFAFHKY